jgi:hypothetical protein
MQTRKTLTASKTADAVKEIGLLDLVQPNGKRLRDCTGDECTERALALPL